MTKYFIEHMPSKKWLTIGGNTTTDVTHPGLISFDDKEQANYFLEAFNREDWEVTEHMFI